MSLLQEDASSSLERKRTSSAFLDPVWIIWINKNNCNNKPSVPMVIASLDSKFANLDRKIPPLHHLPDAHRIKDQSNKAFVLAALLDVLREIEL